MLSAKQEKCLNMLVSACYTQREIAKEINVTEKTICEWKKKDEFRKEYDARMRASVKSMAAKALKTETDLLNAESEAVRLAAAKDILDRAGFSAEENAAASNGDKGQTAALKLIVSAIKVEDDEDNKAEPEAAGDT